MKNIFLILSLLALSSCKSGNPTGPGDTKLQITAQDASCTEVWMQIAGETGKEIQLTRNGKEVQRFTLSASPFTVVDDSLLVKTSYTYQATRTDNGEKSNIVTATTLDTTSGNWNWEMTQLGGASSSALYDVAIINDTLAYAVGQMFINDSTGLVDLHPFCLAKWDGRTWQLKRLYYYDSNQVLTLISGHVQGIHAFSASDVWLAVGSIFHWNGRDSIVDFSFNRLTLPDPNATAMKLWGNSSQDLYGVGDAGTIVHYNGSTWTKIESGTTLDVVDVYGSTNPSTGKQEILAIASKLFSSYDRKILQLTGTTVTPLSDGGITEPLSSVWFRPGLEYYVAGSGIYEKSSLSQILWTGTPSAISQYYIYSIRGNGLNDIVGAGGFGEVLHFNGLLWRSYQANTGFNGNYLSIAVKGNLAIVVGASSGPAVIAVGRR